MSDTPPMFHPSASPQLVSEIKPPKLDPRLARVHKMHQRITAGVRDGSIYKQPRKPR